MDTFLFQKINSLAGLSFFWDSVALFLSSSLAYALVGFLLLALIWPKVFNLKRRSVVVWGLVTAFFARFFVKEAVVFFYSRPRPFDVLEDVFQLIGHESLASFPSGHAIFFFALATVLVFYSKDLGLLFFAGATLMGFFRVFAGVHWPSDILAGAAFGVLVGAIAVTVYARFWENKRLNT